MNVTNPEGGIVFIGQLDPTGEAPGDRQPPSLAEHYTAILARFFSGWLTDMAPGVIRGTLVFLITNPRTFEFKFFYFPNPDVDDPEVTVGWGRYNPHDTFGIVTFAPELPASAGMDEEEFDVLLYWLERLCLAAGWRVIEPDPLLKPS